MTPDANGRHAPADAGESGKHVADLVDLHLTAEFSSLALEPVSDVLVGGSQGQTGHAVDMSLGVADAGGQHDVVP